MFQDTDAQTYSLAFIPAYTLPETLTYSNDSSAASFKTNQRFSRPDRLRKFVPNIRSYSPKKCGTV